MTPSSHAAGKGQSQGVEQDLLLGTVKEKQHVSGLPSSLWPSRSLAKACPEPPRLRLRPFSHLPPSLSPFSSRQSKARRLTYCVWGRAGSGSGSRSAGREQGRPSGRRPKGLGTPRPVPGLPQPHSVLRGSPACPAAPPTPRPQPTSYQNRSPCWLPPAPTLSSPRSSLPPSLQEVPAGLVPSPS